MTTGKLNQSFERSAHGRVLPGFAALFTTLALVLGVAFAQSDGNSAAGTWEGAIEIPGSPLGVIVTLNAEADAWTGTIDIPAQGAMGAPLEAIVVEQSAVSFRIAGVPGEPTFTGEVTGDEMTGTFSQGGQEFPFTLARSEPAGAAGEGAAAAEGADSPGAAPDSEATPVEDVYVDPAGRYSFPVPGNWVVSEHDGFVRVEGPEGGIRMDFVVADGTDPATAIADAWQLIDPELEREIVQSIEPPSDPGVDRTLVENYDVGDQSVLVQGQAQVVGEQTFVMLLNAQLEALQRRAAQLQIIASGFEITGLEQVDLSGIEPLKFEAVRGEFEEYVKGALADFGIPGAAVAVVQDDEVVHLAGYGVKEAGGERIMSPTTQMMIGSVGKTTTSMLIATLVDDGLLDWDTPVVDVLPRFAVADEELTQSLTIRNLLCACTGVPRRDFELAFNYDELSAEAVVESLREFEFFTDFGEAFQYSNQLVATAGYAAAAAVGAPYGELQSGYREALRQRVLEPIGMADTTLDFAAVRRRADYASPHQLALESGDYEPLDVAAEALLTPVEPAGSHWSTVIDLAHYMLTELNHGAAPNGERVVSEANLAVTWEPQVQVSATESYGLGWFVGEYKGLPITYHSGNTLGFSSDLTLVPAADLGIVVIANAQTVNLFTSSVIYRLIELLYQQPADTVTQAEFALEQMEQALADMQDQIVDRVPLTDALTLFGSYTNPALGEVSLRIEDGQLLLDAGEWAIEVRPYLDRDGEPDDYVTIGAPFSGLPLSFEITSGEVTKMTVGEGLVSYEFEPLR